jgi:glycine dehydrogenase
MSDLFRHPDQFADRHLGPDAADIEAMLKELGVPTLDALIDQTVPSAIRLKKPMSLPRAQSEMELLTRLEGIAAQNHVFRSFIGLGYHDTFTPPVILRNILLNPGWYTAYTPYQAEIAQGRLEALLNYQTMVSDLTGLEIANASLLDEGTAAAEAMAMLHALHPAASKRFFVADDCHPQTIEVIKTRALPLGFEVVVGDAQTFDPAGCFGALVQYPATDGVLHDYQPFADKVHAAGGFLAVAADLLSLTVLKPPGEFGADVAIGSTQRFGVPMGFGGPHAAFFATRQQFARHLPGRLIGLSQDANGKPALRMALQTREQHIRREKATSNICTAQVLLAVMASMYAVYHGPGGLKSIAQRVHAMAVALSRGLAKLGFTVKHDAFFDTLRIDGTPAQVKAVHSLAAGKKINFRHLGPTTIGIALDETATAGDLETILACFSGNSGVHLSLEELAADPSPRIPTKLSRTSSYLQHPVFNSHHSETEMQRYLRHLESKDLSLTHAMIPLGSCTMKLNAASEMTPVTWPQFGRLHPFAPHEQAAGYKQIFADLEKWLAEITGFAATSLQPNAGSQGEYAGLLVIRAYQEARGQGHRKVCLIPQSAHGTNPASAVMAGYDVVVTRTDEAGNIDLADLTAKAEAHKDDLAALMVTYPSTHGVFEAGIQKICEVIHAHGGQVYMDGANMNAQVGLTSPGAIGADVCHLNLHKTFCIPHGGGGPGMGPICVAKHLAPFLPGHPLAHVGGEQAIGPVSAAAHGSASILLISWVYIALMGEQGLTQATKLAILSANYIAHKLEPHFPVLYRGQNGRIAHECIVDTRKLKGTAGIEVEDIAKRLMDYGFHAPTVSFPVAGTMMIEPTESEPKGELDRFIDALVRIRGEIAEIESGRATKDNNVLKNAPHTAEVCLADAWVRPYSREKAAFPAPWLRHAKFWPSVGRLNNVLGDRKLICSCPPVSDYEEKGVPARA